MSHRVRSPLRVSSRARSRALGALLALGSGGAGCASPDVDKPVAPDMAGLVESYERPDAEFDEQDARLLVVALAAVDGLLDRTSLRTQLLDVLDDVIEQATDISDEQDDPLRLIDADGVMRVTRICSGWAPVSEPDLEENGSLQVTATFSDSTLDPVVWGAPSACRYLADDSEVELRPLSGSTDGVRVYWGNSVETADLSQRALLVDLTLDARIDGERIPLDFDFRSLPDEVIEYRLPIDGRSLIAQVAADGGVSVRAGNGTFDCGVDLECSPRSVSGEP
jgi:hypothetical protein